MSFRKKVDLDSDIWEDVSASVASSNDSKPLETAADSFLGRDASSSVESSVQVDNEEASNAPVIGPNKGAVEQESTASRSLSVSGGDDSGMLSSSTDQVATQSVQVLREQLQSLREVNLQLSKRLEEESERASSLESGRAELVSKVTNLEKKLAAVVKERESLKRERTSRTAEAELLKEKDAQIEQILEEGEKLSKKILEKEQFIKKLRSKIQDLEKEKEGQRSKIQELEGKIQKLTAQCSTLENNEKSLQASLSEKEQKLKENVESVRKLEEAEASLSSMKQELEEWKRKYQQDLENKEKEWRQHAESLLNSVAMEASRKQKGLEQELELLRTRVDEVLSTAASKEDEWKLQLEQYQRRCRDLEEQLENYALPASGMEPQRSTEVEQLHKHYAGLLQQSKVVEDSLYEKLKLAHSEKKRVETEYNDLKEEVCRLRHEKNMMEERSKQESFRIEELTRERDRLIAELESTKQELTSSRENFENLIQQYLFEINDLKSSLYEERQKKHLKESGFSSLVNSSVQTVDVSWTEQEEDALRPHRHHDDDDGVPQEAVDKVSIQSRSSEALKELEGMTLNAYSFERLKFLVRQLAGDVEMLLDVLKHLEAEHQDALERLNQYKKDKELYEEGKERLNVMQKEMEELKIRYSATLEILGERDEKVQELESDIEDLKTAYQDQINYLLSKLNVQH